MKDSSGEDRIGPDLWSMLENEGSERKSWNPPWNKCIWSVRGVVLLLCGDCKKQELLIGASTRISPTKI